MIVDGILYIRAQRLVVVILFVITAVRYAGSIAVNEMVDHK